MKKCRGKLSKGVLLQQDNARVHTCKVAMDAVEQNGYEWIPHPAYLPDLAPSDFFLFPNLKKDIRGLHFRSDEEVLTAVEERVNGKDPDFFSSGLMALEHHWSKCIPLEGSYIEKEEVDLNRNERCRRSYGLKNNDWCFNAHTLRQMRAISVLPLYQMTKTWLQLPDFAEKNTSSSVMSRHL